MKFPVPILLGLMAIFSGNLSAQESLGQRLYDDFATSGAWKVSLVKGEQKSIFVQTARLEGGPADQVTHFPEGKPFSLGLGYSVLKPLEFSLEVGPKKPIPLLSIERFSIWVQAANRSEFFSLKIVDAKGNRVSMKPNGQFLNWSGWKHVSFYLDPAIVNMGYFLAGFEIEPNPMNLNARTNYLYLCFPSDQLSPAPIKKEPELESLDIGLDRKLEQSNFDVKNPKMTLKGAVEVEYLNGQIPVPGTACWDFLFASPQALPGITKTIKTGFEFTEGKGLKSKTNFRYEVEAIITDANGIPYRLSMGRLDPLYGAKAVLSAAIPPVDQYFGVYEKDQGIELQGFRVTVSQPKTGPGATKDAALDKKPSAELLELSTVFDKGFEDYSDPDEIRSKAWKSAIGGDKLGSEKRPATFAPVPSSFSRPNTGNATEIYFEDYLVFFGTSFIKPDYPGFYSIRNELVKNMWLVDPRKALNFFQSLGSSLWDWIAPQEFFEIIGFKFAPFFDNIYYYLLLNSANSAELARVLAAEYSMTPSQRSFDRLQFMTYANIEPRTLAKLYDFLSERKLPTDSLVFSLKSSAKVGEGLEPYPLEPSLEQLLDEALLVRLDLQKGFRPPRIDLGLASGTANLGLESVAVNRAVAAYYANIPTKADFAAIALIKQMPNSAKSIYRSVLRMTPGSLELDRALVKFNWGWELYPTLLRPDLLQGDIETNEGKFLSQPSKMNLKLHTQAEVPFVKASYQSGEARYYRIQPPNKAELGSPLRPARFEIVAMGYSLPDLLTLVFESSMGGRREFEMGSLQFDGDKTLSFRLLDEDLRPGETLSFIEARVYHLESQSMYGEAAYPSPIAIGALTITKREEK